MSMLGKSLRMERIMNRNTKKIVIVPMDHGVSAGPIFGLVNVAESVNKVAEGGANAVLLHKGITKAGHRGYGKDLGLIIHLSASTSLSPDPNYKVLVTSVEEAIKIGADAVSVHINIGATNEPEMLEILGTVAAECDFWGMPLLAMMYPRGPDIKDEFNVDAVKHAARVGAELGADIVKTNYTGDVESFKEVILGCPVPVVMAGGPKTNNDRDFLLSIKGAMDAGATGVAVGRNVFQHQHPKRMIKAVSKIVHDSIDVDLALKELQ